MSLPTTPQGDPGYATPLVQPEQITPNTVVANPDVRRGIGNTLWTLSLAAGVGALFFASFPEAAFGTDIPTRAIGFVNGAVSLITGAFGFIIVGPNTPTAKR